jgi:hypothetical protein
MLLQPFEFSYSSKKIILDLTNILGFILIWVWTIRQFIFAYSFKKHYLTNMFALSVEILGLFIWAHNRFQKFLEISKPMCVSPCDMQPILLAAQRQEVGARFSPTWEVERDVDQHIRWSVAPLGKWVRREVPHARSSSSSLLARLISTQHDSTRHDARERRGLRN